MLDDSSFSLSRVPVPPSSARPRSHRRAHVPPRLPGLGSSLLVSPRLPGEGLLDDIPFPQRRDTSPATVRRGKSAGLQPQCPEWLTPKPLARAVSGAGSDASDYGEAGEGSQAEMLRLRSENSQLLARIERQGRELEELRRGSRRGGAEGANESVDHLRERQLGDQLDEAHRDLGDKARELRKAHELIRTLQGDLQQQTQTAEQYRLELEQAEAQMRDAVLKQRTAEDERSVAEWRLRTAAPPARPAGRPQTGTKPPGKAWDDVDGNAASAAAADSRTPRVWRSGDLEEESVSSDSEDGNDGLRFAPPVVMPGQIWGRRET